MEKWSAFSSQLENDAPLAGFMSSVSRLLFASYALAAHTIKRGKKRKGETKKEKGKKGKREEETKKVSRKKEIK